MQHQCVIAILGALPVRALPSKTVDLYARAFSEFQLQTGRPPYRMPGLAIGMSHCSECGAQVEPVLVIDEILLQMKAIECHQEYPQVVEGAIDDWNQHVQESLVEGEKGDRVLLKDGIEQVGIGAIQSETGATV